MATLIDENPYWPTVGGKPIVNGFIYIGEAGEDPKENPLNIFSDEDLSIALTNPQRTGSDGRSENKIYLDGKYSIRISDSFDSQVLQDLNRGSDTAISGPLQADNVEGIDDITAEVITGAISGYVDQQEYNLKLISDNTGEMTIDLDGAGVVDLTSSAGEVMFLGQFLGGDNIRFIYSENNDRMELSFGGQFLNLDPGEITIWSGTLANIPNGKQLCDGANGTPNLVDSFILCAGNIYTVDETGGSVDTSSHTLVIAEMPAHTHTTNFGGASGTAEGASGPAVVNNSNVTNSTGGDSGHVHSDSLPPFYALAYIMRPQS